MPPRVLVLRAPGTNCDQESAYAFELAGGTAERVHVNRLLEQPGLAEDFQILCLPGGFSYGDDIAAGRILGNQIRNHLGAALHRFRDAGKLVLGICNGFQILIKSGLLLEDDPVHGPAATLTWNAHGRYEDRWVNLRVASSKSPFLAGIEQLYLPVAHAEGRFVTRDAATFTALEQAGQLVLRYTDANGPTLPDDRDAPLPFPVNPNGAQGNVAGLCDPTGRVFGLMPHPERYIDPTHHPRWTRHEAHTPGDGFRLFQNAIAFFR